MKVFDEKCDEGQTSFLVTFSFKDDDFWDMDTIEVWSSIGATKHVEKYVSKKLKSKYGKQFNITHIQEC